MGSTLKETNANLEAKIKLLEQDMNSLSLANSDLRKDINGLQQYSRRNSLRISNPSWIEHPYEDTDKLVLDLAYDLGINIDYWEIDRSHRVGRPRGRGQRPILVKFIGYRPRERFYEARKKLAMPNFRHLRDVYINEDLTEETGKLAYNARCLKRSNKLSMVFTKDCKVFVRRFPGDPITEVKNDQDLNEIASRGAFNHIIGQSQGSAQQRPPPLTHQHQHPHPGDRSTQRHDRLPITHGPVQNAEGTVREVSVPPANSRHRPQPLQSTPNRPRPQSQHPTDGRPPVSLLAQASAAPRSNLMADHGPPPVNGLRTGSLEKQRFDSQSSTHSSPLIPIINNRTPFTRTSTPMSYNNQNTLFQTPDQGRPTVEDLNATGDSSDTCYY